MGAILSILTAFNGYLTIFGLVTESVGMLIESSVDPEVGKVMKETGAVLVGVGATRKGVKKYKGQPAF